MKKVEIKDIKTSAKKLFVSVGRNISLNSWYFTVLFFVGILIVSLSVWWGSVQNPSPSGEVLIRIEQAKVDYGGMKQKTEDVITSLQESVERFENPPFIGNQREIFWRIDLENPKESIAEKEEVSVAEEEQEEVGPGSTAEEGEPAPKQEES